MHLCISMLALLLCTAGTAQAQSSCDGFYPDILLCASLQGQCFEAATREICPRTCDSCDEADPNFVWATCSPSQSPLPPPPPGSGLQACNGVLDYGLCVAFNRSQCCSVQGLLDICPGMCGTCPPTPSPTSAPSSIPSAVPTSAPTLIPSTSPTRSPLGPLCDSPRLDIVIAIHSNDNLSTNAVQYLVEDLVKLMPVSSDMIRVGMISNIGSMPDYHIGDNKSDILNYTQMLFSTNYVNATEIWRDIANDVQHTLEARAVEETLPPLYPPLPDRQNCSLAAYDLEMRTPTCLAVGWGQLCGIMHGTLVALCPFTCGECPMPTTSTTTTASTTMTTTQTTSGTTTQTTSGTTITLTPTTAPTLSPITCETRFNDGGPQSDLSFCNQVEGCDSIYAQAACPWKCSGCQPPTSEPTTAPTNSPTNFPTMLPTIPTCWSEDDARFCRAPELQRDCSFEGLPPYCVAMCSRCGPPPPTGSPTTTPTALPTTHCLPMTECQQPSLGNWNCAVATTISVCEDIVTVETDSQQGNCSTYTGQGSIFCGVFDTDDFNASELCCACGGGTSSDADPVAIDECSNSSLCTISCMYSEESCDNSFDRWPVCGSSFAPSAMPSSSTPTNIPSGTPTEGPRPTSAPSAVPTVTPRCHGVLDMEYCQFVDEERCNDESSSSILRRDCQILCRVCPMTDSPSGAPSFAPSISLPTLSPTIPTCNGVPDYEFCLVLRDSWCDDDPRTTVACPLKCGTCNETQAPTEIPTISPSMNPRFSCNGVYDAGFCFDANISSLGPSCEVDGLAAACVSLCGQCPPTPDPTGMPSTAPTSVPSDTPSTLMPTHVPTSLPTLFPSNSMPTTIPTLVPSLLPTFNFPTSIPSGHPSITPSGVPSFSPSSLPSSNPSATPSAAPASSMPTGMPSASPTYFPTPIRTCDNGHMVPSFRGVPRICECGADCLECVHDGINAGACLTCMNARVLDTEVGDCFDERLCSSMIGSGNFNKVCVGTRYNASVILVSAGSAELPEAEQNFFRAQFAAKGAMVWHVHGSDTQLEREEILRQASLFTNANLCGLTDVDATTVPSSASDMCVDTLTTSGHTCTCGDNCHTCHYGNLIVGECVKCRNATALLDGVCVTTEECLSRDYVVEGTGNYNRQCVCMNNEDAFTEWMDENGFNPDFGCERVNSSFGCVNHLWENPMSRFCKQTCDLCP